MTRMLGHLCRGLWITWTRFPSLTDDERRAHVKKWSGELMALAGIDVRVRGSFPASNVVLVANHISWADIFAINAVHPVSFVAKAELATWPVAGRLLKNVGTLFIDRSKKRDTARVVPILAQHLRDGVPLAFFPEGRVSHGVGVHPFNASLLQPAVEAQCLVQPIVIRYDPLPSFDYVHCNFLQSVWRVLGATQASVSLELLPLHRDDNRRRLAKSLEDAIRASLQRSADARPPETPADPPDAGR
jgi:1-acyl-sn-glycerol-3-phosphate acyltransferase